MDKRLFELTILYVARRWTAQYEWFAHAEAALKAGVAADVIEAIRVGRPPAFASDEQKIVAAFTTELNRDGKVSEEVYAQAIDLFGLDLVIELVSVIGFYTMVALVLNAFEAPVPGGSQPLAAS